MHDAPGSEQLHPLLAARSSPAAFDPAGEVSRDQLDCLLEAARRAPSAGNSQPWAFIAGLRGDQTHARLVEHLAGSSARWAPSAGLLLANLAHLHVAETDWHYSEFSLYDLGGAVAQMTVQAAAMGLAVRQFRAFDRDGLAAAFAVTAHWQVTTMSAIGYPADASVSSPGPPSRERRDRSELLWPLADEGRGPR